jgi:hypothetical protein
MGMIATAGLIGGIGKGLEKVADVAIQRDFAKLEEAKQIRIAQLQAQLRMNEQNVQIQASKDLEAQRQAGQKELNDADNITAGLRTNTEITARASESEKDRQARAALAKLDRESAEKIADTRTKASASRAFKPEKFTTNTIKASTIDGKGNISEIETLAVTRGGQTFIQLGKNFVPYEAGKPAKEPTFAKPEVINEAIKRITPKNAEQFLRIYGFVPSQYIKYIAQADNPFGNQESEAEEE